MPTAHAIPLEHTVSGCTRCLQAPKAQKPPGRQDKLHQLKGRAAAHGPAVPDCLRLPPDPAAEHERRLKAELMGGHTLTPAGVGSASKVLQACHALDCEAHLLLHLRFRCYVQLCMSRVDLQVLRVGGPAALTAHMHESLSTDACLCSVTLWLSQRN